ncbi:NADP-dependent oxidoreductase [Salinactinospora qingdaonensis]|uniref:NADP-dependent oxidoreductase n=1 Tax=Salinactinospora qingdaonensis TaxID=702744 RepID=A0ABP7GKC1_9ACTN
MRAVTIPEFGGPDVLRVAELPLPEPGEGQVRVRVAAATVNPTDTVLRAGMRGDPPGPEPWVPGTELSGVVDTVGEGVADWAAGERVVAATMPRSGHGAQAEYVVVPAEALARIPDDMGFAAAATIPMNGLTVRQAFDKLELPAGATLVVTGAAGAVGGYAVELGVRQGLRVIADAGPADEELVRRLGADVVVPRGAGMVAAIRAAAPEGVDGLIDAAVIGGPVLEAVRDGGRVAAVRPFDSDVERGITVDLVLVVDEMHEGEKLQELVDLAARGELTLRVARVLPVEEAAEAHRQLEAGGTRGRLVLSFDSSLV